MWKVLEQHHEQQWTETMECAYLYSAAGGKEAGRGCLIVAVNEKVEIELAGSQLVLYHLVSQHAPCPQAELPCWAVLIRPHKLHMQCLHIIMIAVAIRMVTSTDGVSTLHEMQLARKSSGA
jgi:hypothetical protein